MAGSNQKPPKIAPRCYWKHGAWWFVSLERKWIRLGVEPHEALQRLADLTAPAKNMLAVFQRYRREILTPKHKAPRTIAEQTRQIAVLEVTFGGMQPREIRSTDVAAFHDAFGEAHGPVNANRHVSLLSHVFKYARRWGYVDHNPCAKLGRHKEAPRERYVTDAELAAVYPHAEDYLQILIDLGRLCGQREGNLIRLTDAMIDGQGITFPKMKRGKTITVAWSPDLRAVVERARLRKAAIAAKPVRKGRAARVVPINLVVNERGAPVTVSGLQSAIRRMWADYAEACRKEGKEQIEHFVFHDIRAKAGSETTDERLLGHVDPRTFRRVYQRKPVLVSPVK